MYLKSPRNIALFNAVIIAAITGIILSIISFFIASLPVLVIISSIGAVFVFSYVLINYSIGQFLFEKINIIYRTIGELNVRRDKPGKSSSSDVLDIVNQVVLRWSKEKKQEIEELKQMAAYRREFLGNVSHELKTPVFNIQGYIDTLLDGGLYDNDINEKFLMKSQKSVNRMIALVEDLEEISKLESTDLKLNEDVFNLYELTNEAVDFMEEKARKNNTRININANLSRTIKAKADKKRIKQVFINLIDNAIKYGNEVDPSITISFYDFHESYLVEITDNGIGIPEPSMVRIFERFYRTDESRSRDRGGTGLGLAIVKHIIEAHRQTISVRSNPGDGTTFSFTLKQA